MNESLHTTEARALDFQTLACRKFGCPPENYTGRVFWECLYPHAKIPARLILPLHRGFFAHDFEMIQMLAQETTLAAFRSELQNWRQYHRPEGWLRHGLKIRVSARRLARLGVELFGAA
ncbi:MAG: hypothetical protein AB1705_05385 [Verrucomicrobiota bacterium]